MARDTLARLAITAGEPAGIGPDLCIKLAQHAFAAELVFVTSAELLAQRASQLGIPLRIKSWDTENRSAHVAGEATVFDVGLATDVIPGRTNPANAEFVLQTLRLAAQGCLDAHFDAMVTGPVQKSVINDAGIAFSGHTEFLAEFTGAELPVMMLATEGLRVALVTTHLPVAQIPQHITHARVESVLNILHRDLQTQFGLKKPRIIVSGLNPHAGESGHLGREEIDVIIPVLDKLRAQGMDLLGPLPADTLFTPKYLEGADAVLAMYHDQGLPVLKYVGFGRAINVTLGLPIVRTSVDHGTALELAGTGRAETGSMILAVNTAMEITQNKL